MELKDKVGIFNVIDSFVIRRKNEFYLIGQLSEGELKEGYYINIVLNPNLLISAKISLIEDVEISNDKEIYKLIIINNFDKELNDILFCQNVGSEKIYITTTGED